MLSTRGGDAPGFRNSRDICAPLLLAIKTGALSWIPGVPLVEDKATVSMGFRVPFRRKTTEPSGKEFDVSACRAWNSAIRSLRFIVVKRG